MAVTKRRLSINLSFLNLARQSMVRKSPKTFHDQQNGVVGLQILAALNRDRENHHQDSIFIKGFSSGLVPKPPSSSSPTPIISSRRNFEKKLSMEEMEEYTCVISHVGDNLIKKREYFEADLLEKDDEATERVHVVSDNSCGGFLNTCFLCDKVLHGLDIFMYRGEKAFCSVECRHEQISMEESKDKHLRSMMREPLDDFSASPRSSSPLQFLARVAAA